MELGFGLRTICERAASVFDPMEREPTHPQEIRLLGAIEITASDGANEAHDVPIGGRIQRRILAALLSSRPDVVSIDRLIDITWADDPPARAEHNIRTYISRLRTIESDQQIGDAFPAAKSTNSGVNVGPNGLQLITGSERGATIWNLDVDSWPEIACRAAGSELTEDEWAQWGPKDEPYRQVCS